MTIKEELQLFIDSIIEVSSETKYWFIRTQGGELYNKFRQNNFVSIEHLEVSLSKLHEINEVFKNDSKKKKAAIRNLVVQYYKSTKEDKTARSIGLTVSQINKFYSLVKKGDIVIIPSENSEIISIGKITESHIANFSENDLKKIEISTILNKKVEWIKDIYRNRLDPYFYRMFTCHHALNDVTKYSEIIERSIKDFFILENDANLIIDIQTENKISAKTLFGLGTEILNLIDEFSEAYDLDISSDDLVLTINLNSPGSINFKSGVKKTIIVGGLILAIFGGGYEAKDGTKFKTDGLPGLISSISEFLNARSERQMKEELFDQYKDDLKVKDPEDIVILFKQFSEKKNKQK